MYEISIYICRGKVMVVVMERKILLLKILSGFILGVIGICITYYLIQHSSLELGERLSLRQDWFIGVVTIFTIIGALNNIYSAGTKIKKLGEIKIRTSKAYNMLFAAAISLFSLTFTLDLFIDTSASSLLFVVLLLGVSMETLYKAFIGTGIGEKGVVSKGEFYFWENIKSYAWKDNSGKLIIKFKTKDADIINESKHKFPVPAGFTESKVALKVPEGDREYLDNLLKAKMPCE
jgi:hypothetical protein